MTVRGARGAIAGALLAVTIAAAPAWAQQVNGRLTDPVAPLITEAPAGAHGVPIAPLDAAQLARLEQARSLHLAGKLDKAQSELQSLLSASPHQPVVLTELAQVLLDRDDFAGVERLARGERQARRDSLVLGHELETALESQKKVRDAAEVTCEVWIVAPVERDWARETLQRLADADARGVRDALRKANEQNPERADIARAVATAEWRAGDFKLGLRALAVAERTQRRMSLRWSFAEELLGGGGTRDSSAAIETLLDVAGDRTVDAVVRSSAASRAWDVATARHAERDLAPRVGRALADLPPDRWSPELRLLVARALRETGHTQEARALLPPGADRGDEFDFALERALTDLREGPPQRAYAALAQLSGHTRAAEFYFAEALFFGGLVDSAHAVYTSAASDPRSPFAGAALERLYLLEEEGAKQALPAFGRVAYADWRGDHTAEQWLADSLYHALPRGALWAQAALLASAAHLDDPDPRRALEPLLAVADSLPGDRLAPVARQRAGDLYLDRLKDERAAVSQYEACLVRYPRAWNAAEVRRRLDALRRDRRF